MGFGGSLLAKTDYGSPIRALALAVHRYMTEADDKRLTGILTIARGPLHSDGQAHVKGLQASTDCPRIEKGVCRLDIFATAGFHPGL